MLPLWCLTILGSLLPPSQGLLNLGGILGSGPAQPTDGGLLGTNILGGEGLISKKGGLLGTGLLGEGGLLGTGLLGRKSPSTEGSQGLLGTENESKNTGVLGTGLLGGEGLLGTGLLSNKSLLGEKGLLGTGLLGKDGLVGNGNLLGLGGLLGEGGLLGQGEGGLLGQGGLGGLLGEGGVGGLLGEGGPLGAVVPDKSPQHFSWMKMLSLDKARASWKVLPGGELVLNLYSKLTFNLPGIFLFLSGSSVETNITSHIALTQDTPGDLKLVIKDCSNLYGGIKVNLRKGLFTNVVSGLVNSSLRSLLPALFCPLVNTWFSIINIKLQFLNRIVFFGLLGKIQSALSSFPVTLEQSAELDLQNYPFPAVFIDWLLQIAGIKARSTQ
ncbi:BPI fold-containing family B member 4-like [Oxyura jamaicensis]|uniref:BPI fold-containing family B member 4-like n=1 Tax=Oxyura jamaicensis TaxID=8884 RepID=UPI0015A50C0B|nr:BPI fold-containing family B member 4-like [Oxyura jamaicensis]